MSTDLAGFEPTEAFARQMDERDPLARFRDRFHLPEGTIYLLGNSLGLLSRDAERAIGQVVDEWRRLAIRGWIEAESPWFHLAERVGAVAAPLVGARPEEVVATGTTTVNIHALVSTLYRPEGGRTKILADELNFPTDLYALKGQLALRGRDPDTHLVLARSRDGRTLEERDIIELMTDEIALVHLPSVVYRSAQLLDMETLARAARERGIPIGFDCSHSVGLMPHRLDEWEADYAVWCGYKYLNSGPGGSAFLYLNRRHFDREPLLAGWFGYVKDRQFDMLLDFEHAPCAGGWQISSPTILGLAPLVGSLEIIREAGIDAIREKSRTITSYIVALADELLGPELRVGSPRDPERRGGHVALETDHAGRIHEALAGRGVIVDLRPPGLIRLCPAPLYSSYEDVWRALHAMAEILASL